MGTIKTHKGTYEVSFYVEGSIHVGFYAYHGEFSPPDEFGRGKTIHDAIINLLSRQPEGDDGQHDEVDPIHHMPGAVATIHPMAR